ncbi:hypothetical protein KC622_01615, partial [Candidatus Dojkabacteria bacterium]|nr:hypothetical protein [Candidatus Dojkabacteria bacterium]
LFFTALIFLITAVPIHYKIKQVEFTKAKESGEISKKEQKKILNKNKDLNVVIYQELNTKSGSDIYHFVTPYLADPTIHPRPLPTNTILFADHFKKHLPKKVKSKYMTVIANSHSLLWFNSLTDTWGREKGLKLSSKSNFSYKEWKSKTKTGVIILLEGTKADVWLEDNNLKIKDFKVLYHVGDNYLLRDRDFLPKSSS